MILGYDDFHGRRIPILEAYHVLGTDSVAAHCGECGYLHTHSRGDGHRTAHCHALAYAHGYILCEVGALTRGELYQRFPAPGQTKPRAAIRPAVRARVFERDGFRCRRCGNGPEHSRLVLDHIIPIASGGSDDKDNLQTLCELCNAGKRDRAPHPHDLRPFGDMP